MKFLNSRPKKIIFWVLMTLVILVVLVIAFISPLTKWAIEKYDVKYTGREITLDLAYVNPFTGSVYLKNLEIHEAQSDSVFFSTAGLSVNLEMLKLFSKTYEISSLSLNSPVAKIIQDKKVFNFDDLIKKFASKDTVPKAPKPPVHFNLLNVSISNGTFYYIEKSIPVHYFIKEVNVETNGKRWDADTMGFRFSLVSGIGVGGSIKGNLALNTASSDYKLGALINRFDLSILEQYVKDIANYAKVRGTLDADLKAEGNFKNAQNLVARGPVSVNEFHFGKSVKEDYLSFKRLSLGIIQLSPKNKKFLFDSISLLDPYFKYERYDYLDNLQEMFGKKGEKAQKSKEVKGKVNILFQIGNYVAELAKNFFKSDYKVQRLAIYNADIRYNDFTLNEEFSVAVSPMTLIADSIERSDKWVGLDLKAKIRPYGNLALNLSINPKDSSDFTLKYSLNRVSMAQFNPYFVTYTSFPLDRGILEFNGTANVNNGIIQCNNHLVIIDPRINEKQRRNGAHWLPLRFFMFFVRERGNVIDYEVPVTGDLRNPKFKFGDVITDILTNIFVKPVTTAYRVKVKNTENEIEKSLTLKWVMRGALLNSPQEKFVRNVADFLKENPNETITVTPDLYTFREKEYILFFEAKKKYYLSLNKIPVSSLTEKDSLTIEKIPIKDSTFVLYLNKNGGKKLHTVQEKCRKLVSAGDINRKLKHLNAGRQALFLSFFREAGVEKQVRILAVRDTVPFNGFSQYRLDFKGDLPDKMKAAYEEINELDNNSPRNKFKEERSKNSRLLDIK